MIIKAITFGICAFVASLIILGLPVDYGSLGRTTPYPLAVVAAISAIVSSLILSHFNLIPRYKNILAQGLCVGLATVIFAHILFGPFSYFYSLLAGHSGHINFARGFLLSFISWVYTLAIGYYLTIPIGVLGGVFAEYLVARKGSNKSLKNGTREELRAP